MAILRFFDLIHIALFMFIYLITIFSCEKPCTQGKSSPSPAAQADCRQVRDQVQFLSDHLLPKECQTSSFSEVRKKDRTMDC